MIGSYRYIVILLRINFVSNFYTAISNELFCNLEGAIMPGLV
jgi:hypothetical protein